MDNFSLGVIMHVHLLLDTVTIATETVVSAIYKTPIATWHDTRYVLCPDGSLMKIVVGERTPEALVTVKGQWVPG